MFSTIRDTRNYLFHVFQLGLGLNGIYLFTNAYGLYDL